MTNFWKPGDLISWRGIYRERIWHVQTVIVVKDAIDETVIALLTGTECIAAEGYLNGKDSSKRRWHFKEKTWELEKYSWHTHRLLIILEPEKYYATMLFWHDRSNEFICYYNNFQLPFRRSQFGIDTLDLDLDLIVNPDFSYEWKDVADYQKAIENEIILPEWMQGIELATREIFSRLNQRQYPYDGSWLNWVPDPSWSPPKLPENWDKI